MRADADLPWYWGTGASTADGDAGLRSVLGGQLAILAAGIIGPRQVDASQAEDAMLDRIGLGQRVRRIEARLRLLRPLHVVALHLHYSGRTLPYGVDAAAALLPRCVAMVDVRGAHPQDLRGALHAATEAVRRAVRADSDRLVLGAQEAYEQRKGAA